MSIQIKYPFGSTSERIVFKSLFKLLKLIGLAPLSFKKIVSNYERDPQVKIKLWCQSSVFDSTYQILVLIAFLILSSFFNCFLYEDDYPDIEQESQIQLSVL